MNEPLPHFAYHPDPVASGAVVPRSFICASCNRTRTHVYVGPAYATQDFSERVCPWCIADGAAARNLGVEFADAEALLASGVPQAVVEEVTLRTPGYVSWQGDQWLSHCNDACAFLGDASLADVENASAGTIGDWCRTNRQELQGWKAATDGYAPGGQPAFYKFQCRHCGTIRLGWDFH